MRLGVLERGVGRGGNGLETERAGMECWQGGCVERLKMRDVVEMAC